MPVWTPPRRTPGNGAWAAWLAGAVALGAEAVVGGTAAVILNEGLLTGGGPIGYLILAVMAGAALVVAALVGSAAAVLPLHLLAAFSARRAGVPDRWWRCLVVVAAAATVLAVVCGVTAALGGGDPAVLTGSVKLWAVVTAFLAPATLCSRAAARQRTTGGRWGVTALVFAGGFLLWMLVVGAGIAAYATGLL